MKKFFCFVAFVFLLPSFVVSADQPVEFVVVVTAYNQGAKNRNRCLNNLESIKKQTYPHFSVIYVDDCSTDNMGALVDEFVAKNKLENKFTVIHNTTRVGKMHNQYRVINKINPHKVIIDMDGDDELAHKHVLDIVASYYADKTVWMTYGSYKTQFGEIGICDPFPKSILESQKFRSCNWRTSHLKTYYAKLFQLIDKKDVTVNGNYIAVCEDQAIIFPMLEMAGNGHFRYINNILYIFYVTDHAWFGDNALPRKNLFVEYVLSRHPYAPLKELF